MTTIEEIEMMVDALNINTNKQHTRDEYTLVRRARRAHLKFQAFTGWGIVQVDPLDDERVTRLRTAWHGAELSLRSLETARQVRAEIAPQLAALRAKQAILDAI